MGQPKLLLPIAGQTVISRVLSVLKHDGIDQTVVVVRPDDDMLRAEVLGCGAVAVSPPAPPPTMRDSVEFALNHLARTCRPQAEDAWLLSPADHPLLDKGLLSTLLVHWNASPCRILIPTCQGRRGHPVLFRWDLAAEVPKLPADCGINELLRRHPDDICELPLENPAILTDLDTPSDYARLTQADWH